MAFQNCPGIGKVEMRFTQQGQEVENVYHVRLPDVVSVAALDSLAGVFASWFTTAQAFDVSVGLTLHQVIITDLSTEGGLSVIHTAGLPASGTDAATQPPMNVTVAVHWSTGRGGKSFRGRTYHLGLVNTQLTNSTIVPAEATSILNLYTQLRANVETTGSPLVVLSRRSNKALRPVGIGTVITGVSVDTTTDSQRRRLPGRGR